VANRSLNACRRDTHGNVAIISALCMAALMLSAVMAVDLASQLNTKKHMQSALDAAALAGAKALSTGLYSETDIADDVNFAFQVGMQSARGDLTCDAATMVVNDDTGEVTVSAECSFPAMLGGALAGDTVTVTNSSSAQSVRNKIDVAMVLDVSISMRGEKLLALKMAAKEAARILINGREPGTIRVSAASYSSSVNADMFGHYLLGTDIDLEDTRWRGLRSCMSERTGPNAWSDRAPTPGEWYYPLYGCGTEPVLPLTSDLDAIQASIDSHYATASTAGHLGIAWAWYLISPHWTDIWPDDSAPHPYDGENVIKAVILMTDGEFNKTYETAGGSSSEQAKTLCENMRDEGILIFSVAFQAPEAGQDTLKDCAGVNSRFYEASTEAELLAAYEDIALLLNVLKLTS